jgi:hypothetical protein
VQLIKVSSGGRELLSGIAPRCRRIRQVDEQVKASNRVEPPA